MNGKQARRCREAAYNEAKRRHLWQELRGYVFGKWWQRFAAKVFPKYKALREKLVARGYRLNLKRWAHGIYAAMHDPDRIEMERVRRKNAKEREKKRRAALKAKLDA